MHKWVIKYFNGGLTCMNECMCRRLVICCLSVCLCGANVFAVFNFSVEYEYIMIWYI